jgi:hypothetical protein
MEAILAQGVEAVSYFEIFQFRPKPGTWGQDSYVMELINPV